MGSCAAPSAKGDDKFITTDYLQQCQSNNRKLKVLEYLAEKHGISVNEIDEETKKQRNEKGG